MLALSMQQLTRMCIPNHVLLQNTIGNELLDDGLGRRSGVLLGIRKDVNIDIGDSSRVSSVNVVLDYKQHIITNDRNNQWHIGSND
jgi:hypothetical protein